MPIVNSPVRVMRTAGDDAQTPIRGRPTERRNQRSRDELVERIIAEFREMPCLRLTAPQAQRLFGLRSDISSRVITKLVKDGRLRLDPDGRYAATGS